MRKIISLSLIILMIIGLCSLAQANSDLYKVNLTASKREVEENESFVVYISLSDIKTEKGIIVIGASLKYDKDILEIEKDEKGNPIINGVGDWRDPMISSTGRFILDGNHYVTGSETVASIKFTVKETNAKNTTIYLNNVEASDGDNDLFATSEPITINIKSKEIIPPVEPETPEEKPNPPADINEPKDDANQGGNVPPVNNNQTGTSSNSGTQGGTNTSANNNKKPQNTVTTKPVVGIITDSDQNEGNNELTNQNEITEINDENTINEDNIIDEGNIINNVVPIVGNTNEDDKFNYPLLIGGTIGIIALEMMIALKKTKKRKKHYDVNNENYNYVEPSVENSIKNQEDKNDYSQDNSYGSETRFRESYYSMGNNTNAVINNTYNSTINTDNRNFKNHNYNNYNQ